MSKHFTFDRKLTVFFNVSLSPSFFFFFLSISYRRDHNSPRRGTNLSFGLSWLAKSLPSSSHSISSGSFFLHSGISWVLVGVSHSVGSKISVCEAASLVVVFTRSTTSVRCTNVSPSIPGWGDIHGDTGGDGLSSSTGEFLDDDEEEAFDTLEIEDIEDLPPDLDLLDEEDLSTLSSISFVWLERTGELDLFEEPVLSVCVGLETFLLLGEEFSLLEKLLDNIRGETRGSDDLPDEELEQLPDRLGTAPLELSPSIWSGVLGGELVGAGGLSETADASMELRTSWPRGQQLSVVIVIVVDADDVVMHVVIVLVDVDVAFILFSLRRLSSSMFCEVISMVALRSRKKSSSTTAEGASMLRLCF